MNSSKIAEPTAFTEKKRTEEERAYHREWNRRWRLAHPEEAKANLRAAYARRREKNIAAARAKYAEILADPIKLAAYRASARERMRHRLATDLHYRIKHRMRTRIWMAVWRQYGRLDRIIPLLGCTQAHFLQHIESLWLPGMTWKNYGRGGWTIDHIKPCASFDLRDPIQQAICFHFSNTQPLWERDNIVKGASRTIPKPAESALPVKK